MATWFTGALDGSGDGQVNVETMSRLVQRFRHALDSQLEVTQAAA